MKATKIEKIWQKTITKGNDNPLIQYVTGFTLKRMNERITRTTEGHPIEPSELYSISNKGIFRVD